MSEIFVVLLPEDVNITDNNLAIPAIVEVVEHLPKMAHMKI